MGIVVDEFAIGARVGKNVGLAVGVEVDAVG